MESLVKSAVKSAMKDVVETNADLVKSAVTSAMKDLAETNAEQIEDLKNSINDTTTLALENQEVRKVKNQ